MAGQLEPVATLSGHQERVWHAAWNPQGTLLASCSGDKVIRIWGKEGENKQRIKLSIDLLFKPKIRDECNIIDDTFAMCLKT